MKRGVATAVHLNGLLYPLQTRWLRTQLPKQVPIVVQHHGSRPWAKGLRRSIQRVGLRGADGFMFVTAELADEWIEAGLIPNSSYVHEVMETSAIFRFEERPLARAKTGMVGNPIILWAGNLDGNKDPITVLKGFDLALQERPEARLYMAYRATNLLGKVEAFLAQNGQLAEAVTLLGTIPHERLADYFNSADLFVQGSRKEGSGLALLECLACGVIPVVTDIPAFRALTGGGQVGGLWPAGDAALLAERLLAVLERPLDDQSAAARDYFEANWTFEVIGRRAAAVYQELVGRRKGISKIG
jgi:glycosyltransferase involved in cell wall biosynthesis